MRQSLIVVQAIVVLLCSLQFSGLAQADAEKTSRKTHETTLKNGLKIIVREDHRAPVVVSQVWYKIGSSYEQAVTGISHALEHMMFKGTPNHPAGEFSRIISKNGGRENAFTGRDYTAYFQILEKSRLPVSFELEADRMRHLTLDPEEFKKEIAVVREERRMRTEDDPQSLVFERFQATAFLNGPYHNPIIGWMDDLHQMSVEQLRDWYLRWYAPNNATLVVAGDVKPRKVFKLAEQYFGDLPAYSPEQKKTASLPAIIRKELPQNGQRRIIVKTPAKLPYLIMGYKTPVVKTAEIAWEPYALEVMAGILNGGDSARIPKNLIRGQQIAASASAGYDMYDLHNNLFMFDGTPTQEHSIDELEKALKEQIHDLQETPVSEDELKRIKAQVIAAQVYQQDSAFYQAMQIGQMETIGLDWHELDNYVKQVRAITADQIQQVAKRYFTDDRLTVAELFPLPLEGNTPHGHGGAAHGIMR
ncbi:MAG: insulinase family protein [Gammaproteobacteria bacterium]|nr:MAG: insulinase family protein [Gammaproteobacteria bacterium]